MSRKIGDKPLGLGSRGWVHPVTLPEPFIESGDSVVLSCRVQLSGLFRNVILCVVMSGCMA